MLAHLGLWGRRYAPILVLLLVAANIYVWQAVEAPRELHIKVLSVGKGDAVLVETPSGTTILLDAGPDASILHALGTALPYGKRRIDALIELSSLPASLGGLPEVLERYQIGHVYPAGDLPPDTHVGLGGGGFIDILALGRVHAVRVSYGSTDMTIASSTPAGDYSSNGVSIR